MAAASCNVEYGGACDVTCRASYVGAPAAKCTRALRWRYTGACVPVGCGVPTRLFVSFVGCGHRFGEVCRPVCASGYVGAPTAVCGSDGVWLHGGACTPLVCGTPRLEHADFTDCSPGYGEACHVKCLPGYAGSPSAVCEAHGKWVYQGSCVPDVPTYAVAFPIPPHGAARSVILAGPAVFAAVAVRVKTAQVPLDRLAVELEAPDGTRVDLLEVVEGCGGTELDVTFDDTSDLLFDCANMDQGLRVRAAPNATLAAVRSPQPAGYWVLEVTSSHQLQGMLQSWSLTLSGPLPCDEGFFMQHVTSSRSGSINGKGGGAPIQTCTTCARLCLSEGQCQAYDCAATELRCRLLSAAAVEPGPGARQVCVRRSCGPLVAPDTMEVRACGLRYGDTCTVVCRDPLVGSPTAECGADGKWRLQGFCLPRSCGAPRVDYTEFPACGHRVGGVCQPECQVGYHGNPSAVCTSNGAWVYGGACDRINCPPPYMPHADFTDCSLGYGEACHVKCLPGYAGSPSAVCEAHGKWVYQGSCVPDVPTYAVAFPIPPHGAARSVILAGPAVFAAVAVRVKTAQVPLDRLAVELEAPDGTRVDLLGVVEGCGGTELDVTFDDTSDLLFDCANMDQGLRVRAAPNATLAAVRSPQPAGYWVLSANSSHSRAGLLQLWALIAAPDPYSGREAFMFGAGEAGQIGLGQPTTINAPLGLPPPGHAKIALVAVGGAHTLFLADDETLYAFGANTAGQLGLGDTRARATPSPVAALLGARPQALACGRAHSAVLDGARRLWVFGANAAGQLGLGDTRVRATPYPLGSGDRPVSAVACGAEHSAMLTGTELWVWRRNHRGQLGLPSTAPRLLPVPLPVEAGAAVTAMSLGSAHSAFLAGGRLYLCGRNDWGELGTPGPGDAFSLRAWAPPNGAPIEAFALGGGHSAVVAGDAAFVFGRNHRGQLGLGQGPSLKGAGVLRVPGGQRITAVALGEEHSAVLAGGRLYTSGANSHGQLGVGDYRDRDAPAWVPSATGQQITHVVVGQAHGAFLSDITFTPTATASATPIPTRTPTATPTPTATGTGTPSRSLSPSPTVTATSSCSPTASRSPLPSCTLSPTLSLTAATTSSQTASGSPLQTLSTSLTWTATPSATPTATSTPSPVVTLTATTTASPTVSSTKSPVVTLTATATAPPTATTTQSHRVTLTATTTAPPTATTTQSHGVTLTATTTAPPTATTTQSHRVTLTATTTAPPTATTTQSHMVTLTATRTASPTASSTRSQTATQTASICHTVTDSVTRSYQQTLTPTTSKTAPPSVSFTPTPTPTASTTATQTRTATLSRQHTLSPTLTHTASFSPTTPPTPSHTLTPTPTVSRSPTRTPSPLVTRTLSGTCSPTPSRVYTHTPTHTPTLSLGPIPTYPPTITPSTTATPSPSITPSSTLTASASPFLTASATQTVSPLFTPTTTQSPSPIPSSIPSLTPSLTPSQTPTSSRIFTLTPALTGSPTGTPSCQYTSTPTTSLTASPSTTATSTATPSGTPTPTSTSSPTPTETATPSPSASPSGTVPPSRTLSFTATCTASTTQTPLPTTTTTSPTTTAELPSCNPDVAANGHTTMQAGTARCIQSVSMGSGSSSTQQRKMVIRILKLDGGLTLELVSGCASAGPSACAFRYTAADVGREFVLPVGRSDIEALFLYEPQAPASGRQLLQTTTEDGFSVEIFVVHTASALMILVLGLGLFIAVPLVALWARRRSRRRAETDIPDAYWKAHDRNQRLPKWRLWWPRDASPWLEAGLWTGLYLIVAGAAWFLALFLMTSADAPGFPYHFVGAAIAGVGALGAMAALLLGLHDAISLDCPGCDLPMSRWRFIGVWVQPRPGEDAQPRKGHARCLRCVPGTARTTRPVGRRTATRRAPLRDTSLTGPQAPTSPLRSWRPPWLPRSTATTATALTC